MRPCLLQCTQSRAADQFDEEGEANDIERASSFSWYYMAENIGNLFGESANPEMRATIGPLYAMLSITGTLIVGFAVFLAGRTYYVLRPCERERRGTTLDINEEQPSLRTRLQRAWDWRRTDDARAVWKTCKIYLILVGACALASTQLTPQPSGPCTTSSQTRGTSRAATWTAKCAPRRTSIPLIARSCFTASRCIDIAPDTMCAAAWRARCVRA